MSIRGVLRNAGIESNGYDVEIFQGSIIANNIPWITQGKKFFVKPSSGNDNANGLAPRTALKTIAAAYAKCVANRNDTVVILPESDTAADTTDYQTTLFTWEKNLTHLVGMSPQFIGHRARIETKSTWVAANELMRITANGCVFSNLQLMAGVAADANLTGCCKVTGKRNLFNNVHFAGIGNNTNDIAGAYSLWLAGAEENLFYRCVIGLDTVARGSAANYELYVSGASARNKFEQCFFLSLLEHATNHPQILLADATSIDKWLHFHNCQFYNISAAYAYVNGGVFSLPAISQGMILISGGDTVYAGATKWDVNDRDKIWICGPATPAADTPNLVRAV